MEEANYLDETIGYQELAELTATAGETSDLELVERMCTGDGQAVREIVARYEKKLIAYSQRIVCSEDLAKDVCQDVFVKLINRPPTTLQNGNLGPWLFRVAHNLSIDLWRRRKFEITGEELPEGSSGSISPFSTLTKQHDIQLLRELIKRLPTEYRQVVELRIYAEMPYREIALTLDIPQGTALWRYHESIKLLSSMWRRNE